jgi:hypothetical protein
MIISIGLVPRKVKVIALEAAKEKAREKLEIASLLRLLCMGRSRSIGITIYDMSSTVHTGPTTYAYTQIRFLDLSARSYEEKYRLSNHRNSQIGHNRNTVSHAKPCQDDSLRISRLGNRGLNTRILHDFGGGHPLTELLTVFERSERPAQNGTFSPRIVWPAYLSTEDHASTRHRLKLQAL